VDELRERAEQRLQKLLAERGNGAQLYGHDPNDGVGGFGAFFLLLDEPEVYGLPPDPVVPTAHLPRLWKSTALAASAMFVGLAAAFVGGRR
jgi:formate dehydrogenase iron-sulfur subunit